MKILNLPVLETRFTTCQIMFSVQFTQKGLNNIKKFHSFRQIGYKEPDLEVQNRLLFYYKEFLDDDIERDSFAKNQEKIKDESEMRRKRIEKPPKALQKYRLKNQMWLRKPKIMSDVEKGQACPAVEKFVSLLYSEDVKIDVSYLP